MKKKNRIVKNRPKEKEQDVTFFTVVIAVTTLLHTYSWIKIAEFTLIAKRLLEILDGCVWYV